MFENEISIKKKYPFLSEHDIFLIGKINMKRMCDFKKVYKKYDDSLEDRETFKKVKNSVENRPERDVVYYTLIVGDLKNALYYNFDENGTIKFYHTNGMVGCGDAYGIPGQYLLSGTAFKYNKGDISLYDPETIDTGKHWTDEIIDAVASQDGKNLDKTSQILLRYMDQEAKTYIYEEVVNSMAEVHYRKITDPKIEPKLIMETILELKEDVNQMSVTELKEKYGSEFFANIDEQKKIFTKKTDAYKRDEEQKNKDKREEILSKKYNKNVDKKVF